VKRPCTNIDRRTMVLAINGGKTSWIDDLADDVGLRRFDTRNFETIFHQWASLTSDAAPDYLKDIDLPNDLSLVATGLRHLGRLGMDINQPLPNGSTPLHSLVSGARSRVRVRLSYLAQLFLQCGADPNLCDNSGQTPMHRAGKGDPALVDVLLAGGADINAKDWNGNAPISRCFSRAKTDDNVAWRMIERGALTPTDARLLENAVDSNDLICAEHLLRHGHDVNQPNFMGRTPVYYADQEEMLSLLLHYGARLDVVDRQGCTPLASFLASACNPRTGFSPNGDVQMRVIIKLIEANSPLGAHIPWMGLSVEETLRKTLKSKSSSLDQRTMLRSALTRRAAVAALDELSTPETLSP
jgi:ankyrin repeat protein